MWRLSSRKASKQNIGEIETEPGEVFLSQAEMFRELFRTSNALSGIGRVDGNPAELRVK